MLSRFVCTPPSLHFSHRIGISREALLQIPGQLQTQELVFWPMNRWPNAGQCCAGNSITAIERKPYLSPLTLLRANQCRAGYPFNTISPVGWGTPPAGSTVTAHASTVCNGATCSTIKTAFPSGSTSKIPAETGVPAAINHS